MGWLGLLLAAGIQVGCANRGIEPERAVSLKIGSPPKMAEWELGKADFDFKAVVGSDQYFGESRRVGYTGQYLFVYRNGGFIKVCEMPAQDLRWRPNWDYLVSRVNQVVAEPPVVRIADRKPPPPDPNEEQFFWNAELPVAVITLPLLPAFLIGDAIQYESDQGIRDFYQGRVIQLDQDASTIDLKKYGIPVMIGTKGKTRLIERFSQAEPVRDTLTSLDVMVQNGRVVGIFVVAGNGCLDNSSN
jgi:hypothetical protein